MVDASKPPTVWDVGTKSNVRWKQAIPGFAHSSPITWGNRVFVTTTVPADTANLTFRRNSGEEGGASAYTKDDFKHSWRVYALDKETGKILWSRVATRAFRRPPDTSRHPGEFHAGDRWQTPDRILRIRRSLLLRPRRKTAVEARPRKDALGSLSGSRVTNGTRPRRQSSTRI